MKYLLPIIAIIVLLGCNAYLDKVACDQAITDTDVEMFCGGSY